MLGFRGRLQNQFIFNTFLRRGIRVPRTFFAAIKVPRTIVAATIVPRTLIAATKVPRTFVAAIKVPRTSVARQKYPLEGELDPKSQTNFGRGRFEIIPINSCVYSGNHHLRKRLGYPVMWRRLLFGRSTMCS